MFDIGKASKCSETIQEGSSLNHPIVIQGVSVADFECLMVVLYARRFSGKQPKPDASLIIPAFRLASMWNFDKLCTYLKFLAEKVLDDVDKIVFAREFKVTEWLVPAHTGLCLRETQLTAEEAGKLGLESLFFISQCREEYQVGNSLKTPQEENIKRRAQAWVDNGRGL
ncbi:hypothetical protein FRC07_002720 [Ceratobasidium sp. 392]|nr:hypothetical protein FRC07_002720 [Ceratobasidium sp. 392]